MIHILYEHIENIFVIEMKDTRFIDGLLIGVRVVSKA